MTANSSDDPGAPESGPNTTTSQFSHENLAGGEFNRSDYGREEYGSRGELGSRGEFSSRGEFGSRGEYGSGNRPFLERREREQLEMEELERRRYMGESVEGRGSIPDLRVDFQGEGPYGSYRGYYGAQFGPMEAPSSRSGYSRDKYYGQGKMNRFDTGPSLSRGGYARDHSPMRRDRFDSGPLGRPGYNPSLERYGYGKDYGSRHEYTQESDFGKLPYGTEYGRSRYDCYARDFGDSYGIHGYGYSGGYGSPGYEANRPYGYGGIYSRDFSPYGYAGDYERFGSDYERSDYGGVYAPYGYTIGYGPYGYGGGYSPYGYGGHYNKREYAGGLYSRFADFGYGRYGRDHSPYGFGRVGHERYSSPYGYGYEFYGRYAPPDYGRPGIRPFSRYGREYEPVHRRGPYGHFSPPVYGPYGHPSYGAHHHPYTYQYGYDRYQGGSRCAPYGGIYGHSPYDRTTFAPEKPPYGNRYGRERPGYPSGYSAHPYGYGRHQSYRGHPDGYAGRQPGHEGAQNRYRSQVPFEGRGPYDQKPIEQGCNRFGKSNPSLDYYGIPPPFPPFSQARSYYPTSFEFYDEEDYFGRLRFSRAKEMAVRVNFDLQRRKFYENVTDSAQNPEFKAMPSRRGQPRFPVDTLRVEFVDFLPKVNSKEHRTMLYELVQNGKPTSVLRRGQSFFMEITFQNRDFNPNRDCLFLNFYLGPNPSVPKKTRVVLPVNLQKEYQKAPSQWDVRIHNQEAGRLTLQVHIPPTASIGCWNCVVESSTRHFKRSRRQFRPSMDIYIIFNPFTPEDSTFMDNDDLRTEYLMNDRGKIFIGGFKSAKGRPWVYGQFDDCVLPAVCVLLEMSKLAHSEWGNPVKVVRAISSMIKAARSTTVDSSLGKCSGLIIPRYEEDFRGGSSPHLWTGSVQIIEEFLKGGASPVKYGHCWVMAALMTTFCRALGLPSRPVTAFVAAINTQDSMTIDKYIDRYGDLLERGPGRDQPDSLWAFHTWCDIWMMRPDLPAGNSGWQACDPSRARRDATETFSGACGPCSSEAIRKGDIGFEKDTDAFYSVLNAYVRYFYEAEQSEWGFLPFMQFKFPVARYILTKAPNRIDEEGDEDFEDVTALYKSLDLPQEEKLMIHNAFRGRNRGAPESDFEAASSAYGPFPMVKEGEELDVAFEFQEPVRVALGEPLTIAFNIHNTSESIRTIQANISCRSVFYTGVMGPHVKRITGQFTLEPDQGETLTLRIDPVEYQEKLIDMSFFKITVTGFVRETLQSFVDEFDFRFDKPKLIIEIPDECDGGKECPFDLSFINPLGMTLTECYVTFEVSGAVRPKTVQIDREVAPRSPFQFHSSFIPRRKGLRHLVACFTSKQLSDINGMRKIFIRE